eukprot:10576373-Ditylum_brightwellii.AAC.2
MGRHVTHSHQEDGVTPKKKSPLAYDRTKKTIEENVMGLQAAVDLTVEQYQNLTLAQKELLHWD